MSKIRKRMARLIDGLMRQLKLCRQALPVHRFIYPTAALLAKLPAMLIYAYYAFILGGICLAVFFFALSVKSRQLLPLLCAALWLLPVIYEAAVVLSCGGDCNIRIDLLFLFPVEIIVLGALSVKSWRSYRRSPGHPIERH